MTVRENMLPSAMVPGLVTIEDKKGNRQNVYPVDAKELIHSGDFKLVENGAVEVARIAATPLRSGMAAGIPDDLVAAEIAGVAGSVIVGNDSKETDKIISSGDNADAVPAKGGTAGKPANEADQARANESGQQAKTQAEKDAAAKSGQGAEKK